MNHASVTARRANETLPAKSTLSVGTAPVNWNNDDLSDWRPRIPFAEMLDAIAAAAYEGTEFGADFPSDSASLKSALDQHRLKLCGSYRWLHFQDPSRLSAELAELDGILSTLANVACHHLIVASAMTPERIALAGQVPDDGSKGWSTSEWQRLRTGLEQVRDFAGRWQIEVHFHNHVGSHVEAPAEVDRLVDYLPEGVDLCFDSGHYAFGGGEPSAFVREHANRIGYVHLKDVDSHVLQTTRQSRLGFLEALRRFVFCPLGQGSANIREIIETLASSGYAGWVVVEQDTCPGDPTETARQNRSYLREACGI